VTQVKWRNSSFSNCLQYTVISTLLSLQKPKFYWFDSWVLYTLPIPSSLILASNFQSCMPIYFINMSIRVHVSANCKTSSGCKVPYFPAYNARVIYTKGSEIVKNEHARYTLERFPTDNARVICTKKGIGKYGVMY